MSDARPHAALLLTQLAATPTRLLYTHWSDPCSVRLMIADADACVHLRLRSERSLAGGCQNGQVVLRRSFFNLRHLRYPRLNPAPSNPWRWRSPSGIIDFPPALPASEPRLEVVRVPSGVIPSRLVWLIAAALSPALVAGSSANDTVPLALRPAEVKLD